MRFRWPAAAAAREKRGEGRFLPTRRRLGALVVWGLLLQGACPSGLAGSDRLFLLSWNVQNLFNGVSEGGEYREFDPQRSPWNKDDYALRRERIGQVIAATVPQGPDILLLQEVENKRTLRELNATTLAQYGYHEVIFSSQRKPIPNVGILSRHRLMELRQLSVGYYDDRPLRDIVEARFRAAGESLTIFLCHWKSKRGGARQTESARIRAATLLSRRIADILLKRPTEKILVVGDLNESWDEGQDTSYTRALRLDRSPIQEGRGLLITGDKTYANTRGEYPILYSPWAEAKAKGSYYYRKGRQWETLDHFLLSSRLLTGEGWRFANFRVVAHPFLLKPGTEIPLPWNGKTKEGYSDHLPLLLTLNKGKPPRETVIGN